MVTHNPENAALAGRVLHIRDGRSLTEGPAAQAWADSAREGLRLCV